jgi:flagellar assembly protein FliH
MSLSDPAELDPEVVEEFQWPDLEASGEAPTYRSPRFQPWEYGPSENALTLEPEAAPSDEEILAAAHLKAQDIEQQAYEDGFQQGQKDGHEVGRRALEEVVKRLEKLAIDIEQQRGSLFRQREKILVDLVLLISEKLLARELSLHPEAIRQIIEEGFRQVAQQEGVRLLVSPPDYEVLRQEDLESWPPEVELKADGTISPGGFRLETSLGELDGSRQTRWNLVVQAVQQALEASYGSAGED